MSFPRVEDDIPTTELTAGGRSDLSNSVFVDEAVRWSISYLVPNYTVPKGAYFKTFELNDGSFAVDTNFDFQAINREYHKTVSPDHSSISSDYLLQFIFEAHTGTFLASRYSAEFVHDSLCSAIMKMKYVNLFRRRERSISEIDLFQNLHLHSRTISEVIKSKERSLEDFFQLLDNARKFKDWLRAINPDEKLIKEYFDAVTRETWIDKLPSKSFRWVITTGLAAAVESFYPTGAAIAASQGLSLADATILDRILKGWRPDQFVKGPLAEFTGVSE